MGVKLDANFGADAARRTLVGLVLFFAGHKEEVVNLQYNAMVLGSIIPQQMWLGGHTPMFIDTWEYRL